LSATAKTTMLGSNEEKYVSQESVIAYCTSKIEHTEFEIQLNINKKYSDIVIMLTKIHKKQTFKKLI